MRRSGKRFQTTIAGLMCFSFMLVCCGSVFAGVRTYMVILANSPKQYPNGGQPAGGFANPEDISRQYFDTNPNNNIFSFAEYWAEISYGDVTITGQTAGWFDLPWPIQPALVQPTQHAQGADPPVDLPYDDPNVRILPLTYYDLNGSGTYEYGMGEFFINTIAASIVDFDGDPLGVDNGPFVPGLGSQERSMRGNPNGESPVWMPGERFLDMDGDGKWDGLDEAQNQMDFHTVQNDPGGGRIVIRGLPDGRPDLAGAWVDANADGLPQTSGTCTCAEGQTCFLPDSDNDGNPDCCPNGPSPDGRVNPSFPCNCPPTQTAAAEGPSLDCNGNQVDDALDIQRGVSRDVFPYQAVGSGQQAQCVPGPGNGVPDECEYERVATSCPLTVQSNPDRGPCCRTEGPSQDNPCGRIPVCVPITAIRPGARCETADVRFLGGDGDNVFDVVEPYENFLRRWNPCLFDPEAHPDNSQEDRIHWIKVYDPSSDVAGANMECTNPPEVVSYGDPSYIVANYPGDPKVVISQAHARPLFGQHDPLNFMGSGACSNPSMALSGQFDFGRNGPCFCPLGIEFEIFGDEEGEEDQDCCNPANYLAGLLADSRYPLPNGRIVGDRKCFEQLDVDGDGMIEADETNVCARIVPLPGGACRSFDVNGNGQIDCPDSELLGADPPIADLQAENKLCIAGFHSQFDPSDRWINETSPGPSDTTRFSAKMQTVGTRGGSVVPGVAITPEPSWFEQAWEDRYSPAPCYDITGSETTCTAPDWPAGRNIPISVPFIDADQEGYDPVVNRRYFKANRGGLDGRGIGWIGQGNENIIFEVGVLGQLGFETAQNRPILPEEVNGAGQAAVFYDGPVEHDDLPSSKYHREGDQWLGEITSPYRTWYDLVGIVVEPVGGETGIERFDPAYTGVEDARRIPAIFGEDLGNNNPNSGQVSPDGRIPAAGPYAINVHGALGRDAGNVLLTEMLTRRTGGSGSNNGFIWDTIHRHGHPYAGPSGEGLGFRDYNLDGLVDLGETRPAGSDNYIVDVSPDTRPDNGTSTTYPWNRQRMLEDCIEVLDDGGVDFDDYVDANGLAAARCGGSLGPALVPSQFREGSGDIFFPRGASSGIVLLPRASHQARNFIGAGSFYPIHNEDGLDDPANATWFFPKAPGNPQLNLNIFFHDLVIASDAIGEGNIGPGAAQVAYSAHEWLHSWEGYPDLYDYNVYDPPGRPINCPVGIWDIMADAALVHPTPILKESNCSKWIAPTDLTTVLTPGVDKVLTIPPAEFVRDDSYFYLENESRLGERFYLWSAGQGFDAAFPGEGLLVMHTDFGANPEALPPQVRIGNHFAYGIEQADGQNQLTTCVNNGDGGDPFPGSTQKTVFDCNSTPAARWYTGNLCSGLSLRDIATDGQGSVRLTANWVPTNIPSLRFIDPPGGTSVNGIYQIRAEITDVAGGTLARFFYTSDPEDLTINPDGSNFIGFIRKNIPGTQNQSLNWNVTNLRDGTYFVFAELVPGAGPDNTTERGFTTPRPARTNVGSGILEIVTSNGVPKVNTNEITASGQRGAFNGTSFTALREDGTGPVNFTAAGSGGRFNVQVNDQVMVGNALRTVVAIENGGTLLALNRAATSSSQPWYIVRAGRTARLESWNIECFEPDGSEWTVYSSLTQPEPPNVEPDDSPYSNALTSDRSDSNPSNDNQVYTSLENAVQFRIVRRASDTAFAMGDRFSFTTTGITALSSGAVVARGRISEGPTAIVTATPLSGDPPLRVVFDGRSSVDPNGEPLEFQWDFGDGTPTATGAQQVHTFTQARTFTVVLRVTNTRNRLFNEAAVDIAVTNNTPQARVTATPNSGRAPLEVRLDATASSDTETAPAGLIYQWNFGDGTTANDARNPGALFSRVTHLYTRDAQGRECTSSNPCNFIATLTVIDGGGKEDRASVNILVGNARPNVSITNTSLEGFDPFEVTFNGINCTDPDGDPVTIEWDWDGDPATNNSQTYPRTGQPGFTDGTVKHTFRLNGTARTQHKVTATVRDNHGGVSQWPGVTVTVNPVTPGSSEPQAAFTITPNPPVLNQPFTVDGRRSIDRPAGGTISSYTWNWGDGTPNSTGAVAEHTYTRVGTFTISLTVADAETPANTNIKRETVVVTDSTTPPEPTENRPPVARFTVTPPRGAVGDSLTLDAGDSTDPDGDDMTFRWSFGDGSSATGERVQHAYQRAGTFQVRLTVTDENNGSTDLTQSVVVEAILTNSPPQIVIATGPREGLAPLTLTFDARNTYDPEGDALNYRWEFKQGEVIIEAMNGSVVTRTFSSPGAFTAELTVTDAVGAVSTAEPQEVTVFATPPSNNNDNDDTPPEQDLPGGLDPDDSADQRPPIVCGLGMMTGLLGCFMGLSLMQATRRRK